MYQTAKDISSAFQIKTASKGSSSSVLEIPSSTALRGPAQLLTNTDALCRTTLVLLRNSSIMITEGWIPIEGM